ncbi:MAG: hypothetical protein GF375_02520 [Candidatus Omnitrophica bacterium]|nr:hypothetical protein [Candidatus Omnitrophota bacterium]MBD3268975.1 hypothetical protein [Candidatus Omnitrophota bacterium]
MKDLVSTERLNFRRYGKGMEDIALCSYPEGFSDERIKVIKSSRRPYKFMKISLNSLNEEVVFGTRYCLTLDLRPYIRSGRLVFLIKSDRPGIYMDDFTIFLKASKGENHTNSLVYSLSLAVDRQWQEISVPFKEFAYMDRQNVISSYLDFPGEVREALFMINKEDLRSLRNCDLFIGDLKITDGQNVIYELF